MSGPYDASENDGPAQGEGEGWLPFVGGLFLGLFAWVPAVMLIVLGVGLLDAGESALYSGLFALFVPGLLQIPAVAVGWLALRRPGVRRGLVVGAVIVAFLNASCWGMLALGVR